MDPQNRREMKTVGIVYPHQLFYPCPIDKDIPIFLVEEYLFFKQYSFHKQSDGDSWKKISLGISIPLFNWNRGNIIATKLAVTKKQGEYNAIQESIAEEVRSTYIIYKDFILF